eukprot:1118606-Prorocentrum_minimum.AAC.3
MVACAEDMAVLTQRWLQLDLVGNLELVADDGLVEGLALVAGGEVEGLAPAWVSQWRATSVIGEQQLAGLYSESRTIVPSDREHACRGQRK